MYPIAKLVRIFQWLRNALRFFRVLVLASMVVLGGCDDGIRSERVRLQEMQRDVSTASRDLVSNEAKSRQHQSEMQRAITDQQSEIQQGLDQLEKERKDIASFRLTDLLTSQTLSVLGSLLAALVPLGLFAWLFRDIQRSDSEIASYSTEVEYSQSPPSLSAEEELVALPRPRPRLGYARDDQD